LDGIESGAEANVQADWSQTTTGADDYIKNKPTKLSDFTDDITVDNYTASSEAPISGKGVAAAIATLDGTSTGTAGAANTVTVTQTDGIVNATYTPIAISGTQVTVASATDGHFAGLDSNGNLTDSGSKASDFATAAQGTKADSAVQSVKLGSSSGKELNVNTNVVIPNASTSASGVVQLTDATNSTSTTTAATPNSVNTAYNLANSDSMVVGASSGAVANADAADGNVWLNLLTNGTVKSAHNIIGSGVAVTSDASGTITVTCPSIPGSEIDALFRPVSSEG
jgi:hypothetical protein